MTMLRSIKIDLDVYKKIVSKMVDTDRDENDALHRILGVTFSNGTESAVSGNNGWSGHGVHLPEGTALRLTHLGHEYTAQIQKGAYLVEGKLHYSPSAAAEAVARTRTGAKPSLDGWKYWEAQLVGETGWKRLDDLRAQARGSQSVKPPRPKRLDQRVVS
ncbi:hypothetical protein [Candidatus Binatus sp.]|uniref:hypothetical protein n=1 Tax=Candidatus Binatus sp. TaxID=2811406 RepID=UPI003C8E78E1